MTFLTLLSPFKNSSQIRSHFVHIFSPYSLRSLKFYINFEIALAFSAYLHSK
ncbi:hypothetical protein BCN_2091 [Bacillus cereus NC7401]|nr:hypothetical protein BCN_2091 [Bacillus cereus NC7401]